MFTRIITAIGDRYLAKLIGKGVKAALTTASAGLAALSVDHEFLQPLNDLIHADLTQLEAAIIAALLGVARIGLNYLTKPKKKEENVKQ